MVPYQDLFKLLSQRKIRYLVAGGFAVNFHQVQRATVDLDLIVQLEKKNILDFTVIMKELGYSPRVPVKAEDLADPIIRNQWIRDKGMMVFSFIHFKNPFEVVDTFVDEFKPFDELYQRRLSVNAFGIVIDVIGKSDLVEMKKLAGRDKDLFDIQQLEKKK